MLLPGQYRTNFYSMLFMAGKIAVGNKRQEFSVL